MELKKQYNWISEKDFSNQNPLYFSIIEVEQLEKDIVLKVQGEIGLRQLSLWGDNLNKLVDGLGSNTDLWIKKRISISHLIDLKGKKLKSIEISK